ncbi:MAG: hypothetical protein ACT4OL_02480 [Nitrospiraceae bacterium]
MKVHRLNKLPVWMLLLPWVLSGSVALAESEPTNNRSVVERMGDTTKKVGDKIGQGFTKAAKKIEDKHIAEKIERKLKKAATKTAEGFKKAGEKIDKKLNR